jgi:tetratricopeptide (TPR) repeat protein
LTQLEIAQRYYLQGRLTEAVNALGGLGAAERVKPEVLLFQGVCLARLRRPEEAAAVLSRALDADPGCYEAITWMAVLKKNRREIGEAIRFAERAIELQPGNSAGYGALGSCLLYVRQAGPAIEAFRKAVALSPDVAEHHHNLALGYLMVHRHREGVQHLRRAIELAPRDVQSYLVLANEYSKHGNIGKALDCLAEGLRVNPRSASLNSAAASGFNALRNDEAAEAHHLRAMELSQKEAEGPYAAWLLNRGRFQEASALYEGMLKDPKLAGSGYYGLTQCRKFSETDRETVREMEALRGDPALGTLSEIHLRYALGKVNEWRDRYQEAMADYDVANGLAYQIHNPGAGPTDFERPEEGKKVVALYERLAGSEAQGRATQVPIFIVGMIRSGTTLLDQILSSHRSVKSAGELQFWTEETTRLAFGEPEGRPDDLGGLADEYLCYIELLAGRSERITDKMPLNFAYAGVIHRALPDARFIHIRRHPVDTCLSIYTTYFGLGPRFAYSKANIVAYYREYLRTMDYWRERLPSDRLLEIDYEELIADPESVIPRAVEFCGLAWDDACLHHDLNTSAINTPSRWQARQPIYRTSLERWRRYEPWLGEFAELLTKTS